MTRCLEIISEASRRLLDALKARHPSIAWKDIVGAGNVYRHDDEDVAVQQIWDTVLIGLPVLRGVTTKDLALMSWAEKMMSRNLCCWMRIEDFGFMDR